MEQTTFDKVRQFVSDHKKEIMLGSACIMIYSIGFNNGFKSAEKGMNYIFDQAAKSLEVTKF